MPLLIRIILAIEIALNATGALADPNHHMLPLCGTQLAQLGIILCLSVVAAEGLTALRALFHSWCLFRKKRATHRRQYHEPAVKS
jgi:hypothetical protein